MWVTSNSRTFQFLANLIFHLSPYPGIIICLSDQDINDFVVWAWIELHYFGPNLTLHRPMSQLYCPSSTKKCVIEIVASKCEFKFDSYGFEFVIDGNQRKSSPLLFHETSSHLPDASKMSSGFITIVHQRRFDLSPFTRKGRGKRFILIRSKFLYIP